MSLASNVVITGTEASPHSWRLAPTARAGTCVRLVIVTREARSPGAPLIGLGSELQLTLDGRAVPHLDVITEAGPEPPAAAAIEHDGELLGELPVGEELELALAPAGAGRRQENICLTGERLAARAASPATRKQ